LHLCASLFSSLHNCGIALLPKSILVPEYV
jgi:hypothetical protein